MLFPSGVSYSIAQPLHLCLGNNTSISNTAISKGLLRFQVAEAAHDMLSVMKEEAALENNKIHLFTSRERFPGVFEARQEVTDADKRLVRATCLYLSSCPCPCNLERNLLD